VIARDLKKSNRQDSSVLVLEGTVRCHADVRIPDVGVHSAHAQFRRSRAIPGNCYAALRCALRVRAAFFAAWLRPAAPLVRIAFIAA